jgi:hypothetical protein
MSNNQKRYQSIYGALKPIRPDQFLVELIIRRRSEKQNIKLPDRFWSKEYSKEYDYWAKIFFSECRHSKPLFDKYDADCVIDAFNSYDCRNILSAANKSFEKIIREFQRRKDLVNKTKEHANLTIMNTNIVPKTQIKRKTRLCKLKDG